MTLRRSTRYFDGREICQKTVQRLEESALGRMERLFGPLYLRNFSYIRFRKTDKGTYSAEKIFTFLASWRITDLGSIPHAKVRALFTQTELADASLLLIVPIDDADDPYDIKLHYRSAGVFLSSAWVEAQKLGLSGTMCGNLVLGGIPQLARFIGAIALCLSGSIISTDGDDA